MNRRAKFFRTLTGFFILLATIAAIAASTALLYYIALEKGLSKGETAALIVLLILFFTVICTVVDAVRRKYSVNSVVDRILAATDAIKRGNFDVRLTVRHAYKRYDEFDYIIENINRMAEELSRTEMLRGDFISNVSHELKTPLSVIGSYAQLLKDDSLDSKTRKKYADTLAKASSKLSDLVVNILKLNKLENQSIIPAFEKVNLSESLAQAVLGFEDEIERKHITLECDIDEAEVYSLSEYLDIVWNNLISNAVKFTDDGGEIGIKLKKDGGYAEVTVSDTGCGIPLSAGEHIFDKFFQADVSHSGEGNGLGLALVKRAISVTGGEISVESEEGKGTTFKVRLRCADR